MPVKLRDTYGTIKLSQVPGARHSSDGESGGHMPAPLRVPTAVLGITVAWERSFGLLLGRPMHSTTTTHRDICMVWSRREYVSSYRW